MTGRHSKESPLWVAFLAGIGIVGVALGIWWVFTEVPANNEPPGQAPATSVSVPVDTWGAPPPNTNPSVNAPENGNGGPLRSSVPTTKSKGSPRVPPTTQVPAQDSSGSGY